MFSGTNGIPNANYRVLVSTNLALPLSEWTRVATNVFGASGEFNFSQAVNSNQPQQFYVLQLP